MPKTFLIVLALLLFSTSANADQVTIGTAGFHLGSGYLYVYGGGTFGGSNFGADVHGRNLVGFAHVPCDQCYSGDFIGLSATSGQWTTGDMWGGMTIDGKTYSFDFYSTGELTFTGGSVTLPFSEDPTVMVTAPFSMTGFLVAHPSMTETVALSLSGSGIAQLNLRNIGVTSSGRRIYSIDSIDYTFQPTPEPATIILLGTGLVGIASALRRRYKNAK